MLLILDRRMSTCKFVQRILVIANLKLRINPGMFSQEAKKCTGFLFSHTRIRRNAGVFSKLGGYLKLKNEYQVVAIASWQQSLEK